MESSSCSINLSRVNYPGQIRLELKGSILIIHKETWVSKYSLYVPVEVVHIEESRNRNYRKLWEGVIGLMVAFLLFLPLSLWFIYKPLFKNSDLLWMLPLIGLFIFSFIVGLRGIISFFKFNPVMNIILTHKAQAMRFSFWLKPEVKVAVENLIMQIQKIKETLQKNNYVPLRICPMWYHSKPYRRAFLVGSAISFILFCIISILYVFQVADDYNYNIWWLYIILPFPPIVSILSEFIRRNFPFTLPAEFKRARRAVENGNYSMAIFELQQLLKKQPHLNFVRFFLIQVLTEHGEFDTALKQCEEFYSQAPSLATELQTTIWWLRCVQERMNETKPNHNSSQEG
ncbi:MAG TPA: tetratricopeptide repeat protein [Candidatus Hydrogenedens sp.]|nr:tetratricopeptide repeat protein [Candidatus Hydrogenedens sp.]HOL19191.1 tetratricopeptide repeat protein [Candidatus Hydrogenedens sp.]HPP58407.1 tetratricopeptide repeat protein [Candidatus Hydrogenedens sp.]